MTWTDLFLLYIPVVVCLLNITIFPNRCLSISLTFDLLDGSAVRSLVLCYCGVLFLHCQLILSVSYIYTTVLAFLLTQNSRLHLVLKRCQKVKRGCGRVLQGFYQDSVSSPENPECRSKLRTCFLHDGGWRESLELGNLTIEHVI